MLEKATRMKGFEYSLLGKELKKQTSGAEKQYQSVVNDFNHNEREEPVNNKKGRPLQTDQLNILYNNKQSFIEF